MNISQNLSLEVKSISEEGIFSGYASVFNVSDSYNDIIIDGAFTQSLKYSHDIKLLWQHRHDEPIGVITKITEDNIGLYIEGKLLLDVNRAKEAYILLKNGAVSGLSIGFRVKSSKLDRNTGSRIITEVELVEVSLVTFPANKQATISSVKSDTIISLVNKAINILQ